MNNSMQRLIKWFERHRSSTRVAFLFQIVTRLLSAALSLVWVRLILEAMGESAYGTFVSFMALAALAGLGDLGLGGAVGVLLSQAIGRNDREGGVRLLRYARGMLGLIALTGWLTLAALAPWLLAWLGFDHQVGSGSMFVLFQLGALSLPIGILGAYVSQISYACGNLTLPVIPVFLIAQGGLAAHWILAATGHPLWIQYASYLASGGLTILVYWYCTRATAPHYAALRPLSFDIVQWRRLSVHSFWYYAWSLACVVYTSTDRLMINSGFGPAEVPRYHLNYKICELAMWAIIAAGIVTMPKITAWMASDSTKAQGAVAADRLQRLQVLAAIAASLVYLKFNDWFMVIWIGKDATAPISWQIAFAINLAITGSADCASQIAIRSGSKGLKLAGIAVLLTALLNVIISYGAMKYGSILGIAIATVIAQCVLSICVTRYSARFLGFSPKAWLSRACAMPVLCGLLAGFLRSIWPEGEVAGVLLTVVYAAILWFAARILGVSFEFLRSEWNLFVAPFRRTSSN